MDNTKLRQTLEMRWPPASPVATTAQLASAGIGDRLLTAGVTHGLVHRIRRGAYIQLKVWFPAASWEREMFRLQAHLHTSGGACTYSHFSAARLHGCWIWDCGSRIHINSAAALSGNSAGPDVVGHHFRHEPGDTIRVNIHGEGPMTVTSLERTVIDCARIGEFRRAVIIGDHALRKGATLQRMQALVESMPGSRGIRRARRVVDALDARSESAGETRTRLILRGFRIEQPDLQVVIQTGSTSYRADFAWKALKLILEFDGKTKYFDFAPTDQIIFTERRREKALMELGWRFLRVEWADLSCPAELRVPIEAAISRARQDLAA